MADRTDSSEVTIKANKNGPYIVQGPARVIDVEGNEWPTTGKKSVALCRCGASMTKPFCDGAHSKIGFQAAERAVQEAEGKAPPQG